MISSFKNYLVEEEKTLYFVWGRMNPPTSGHEKLLDFLKKKAGKNPYRIYLTQSEDKNKNPIPFAQKIKFARKGFPQYARQIMLDKNLKTIFDAMTSFHNEGFKRIVIVAGKDRVNQYDVLLKKYNGKNGKHGFYNFERIDVLSAGNRDPEAEGVEGVSGTKLRGYVKAGDFTKFAQFMPKRLSNADAKQVFNAVRKGLGLKEQKEFVNHIQLEKVSDKREAYINGDLFQAGDRVVIKDTDIVAEVKHLGPNYVIVESNGVQMRKWIEHIEFLERTSSPQDSDIKDRKGTQPAAYHGRDAKGKEMSKGTKAARDRHFKKGAKMNDDNPAAYKKAPGDHDAKTKPSKHTTRFKQMYGETIATKMAKQKIDREKQADKVKHDSMLDRARLRDTRRKNRETA